jgi:hypothetical protein
MTSSQMLYFGTRSIGLDLLAVKDAQRARKSMSFVNGLKYGIIYDSLGCKDQGARLFQQYQAPLSPSFLETENNIKNTFHKPYAALHPHHSNFLFLEDRTRVSFIPDAEARGSCSMWRDISKAVT